MRTELEIKWWKFEEISNRAGKYFWLIESCRAGQETTYSYKTMFVDGYIINETEKAVQISLDYSKGKDKEHVIYHGFTAWIPKSAIVGRTEWDEHATAIYDDITAEDIKTYCSCGIE